MTMPIN